MCRRHWIPKHIQKNELIHPHACSTCVDPCWRIYYSRLFIIETVVHGSLINKKNTSYLSDFNHTLASLTSPTWPQLPWLSIIFDEKILMKNICGAYSNTTHFVVSLCMYHSGANFSESAVLDILSHLCAILVFFSSCVIRLNTLL